MAITITLDDANNDGKGVNFDAYMKQFDKKFSSTDRGGFINEAESGVPAPGGGYIVTGDDYVSWDGVKKGQSVIFEGGTEGWTYDFDDGHRLYGDIDAITFGKGTKTHEDVPEFTNNGEIRVSFEAFDVENYSDTFLSDLGGGETKGFLNFLNSDSIEFVGSAGKDVFKSFKQDDILHGEGGNDKLNGAKGNDTIHGDEGNDKLAGGKGADVFIFETGDGKDKITDFGKGGDLLDFSGMFDNFDAAMDAASQSKKGVTIEYDGGSVLLMDVKLADLDEADFQFAL